MSFNLDERERRREFATYFKQLEDRLAALERSNQLNYASIEGGALDIYDEEGTLKGSVGVQPDGGVALVPVNASPPPTPSPPVVEPRLAGLTVGWDGAWTDATETPTDFALVQVHVGTTAAFEPNVTTQVGTITAPLGGTVTVATEGYASVWVRLVAANTASVTGVPSAAVEGKPRQAVGQDLIDGIVTEIKLAESAVTEAKIALAAVGARALANGSVLINALGGALSDSAAQRYVDTMSDPAAWTVTEKGTGAVWEYRSGIADAPTSQHVGQATGYTRLLGTTRIPYEPGVLYRLSARVRLTGSVQGSETCYVGVAGFAADGTTLVNRTGAGSASGHYYVAASGRTITAADGWVQVVGFVKDRAAAGSAGPNNDPRNPGVLHSDVRYIAPYVWLNYSGLGTTSSSVMQVDCVTLEALKTGIVDSINFTAGAVNTAALAADAVTAGKVAADAISAREIQANAVTASKILAGSITTDKLVSLSVTAEKIASLAITTDKLAALSITSDKMAVNSVTASAIAAGAIDATHIKAGAITADRLALGVDGNLVPDPGFEGALSAGRAATDPNWSITMPGNGSPRALQVNAAATAPVTRSMTLATVPAMPGEKLWLSVDYLASADWNGTQISLTGEWLDASGSIIGTSTVTAGDNAAVKGTWTTLSGVPDDTAPAGSTQLRITCATVSSSAGTVTYDNASARIVLASGVAGARAEISPRGLQLYTDSGEEAVSLLTGRPNYLTLAADGLPVATIDQSGGAYFQNLAVADTLSIGGTDWTDLLGTAPRGIQAINYQTSTRTASGTEMGFVELAADIDASRMYRVVFAARANPSVAGGELQLRLRDGGSGAPTITSTQRYIAVHPMALGTSLTARMEYNVAGKSLGAGLHRFLLTFTNGLGPSGQTCTLSGGSDNPGYLYVEDTGPYVPATGGYNDGGGTVTQPPKKYTKTYACSWSGSYANRGAYNSYYGSSCYQGYYSRTNGVQAALIGFPPSLGSDLSGATILKAELYLYYDHWYSNAGGKAVIKAHSHTSRPATFSSDAEAQTISWARNQGKWVDITSVFDSTRWRGVALDPNSTSSTYYGRARGYGQTNPPQLKVTYTK